MARTQTLRGERSALLDAVRGVAILQVLVWHYWYPAFARNRLPGMHVLAALLNMTWTGVDLFFVLSGFLIGGILLDNRQDHHLFRVFYARRALRILPLYILILTPFLLGSAEPVFGLLTFTQNIVWGAAGQRGPQWIGVTWSLAVEEQFYLVLPLLIRLVPETCFPALVVSLIALAPVARLLSWVSFGNPYACYMLMPCRMDALFAGVLLAWAMRQPRLQYRLSRHVRARRCGLALSGVGLALLLASGGDSLSPLMWSVGYSVIAAFYASLLLELTVSPPAVDPLSRVLRWFGLRAYGIYLLHRPIEVIVTGTVAPGVVGLLIATLLTLLVAIASWEWIERPCIGFGHRWLRYGAPAAGAPAIA
jgi:peptidoglycan/LPS O-acetylase OafA/YrhL